MDVEDLEDDVGGNAENRAVKSLTGEVESSLAGDCVRRVDVLLSTLDGGLLPARDGDGVREVLPTANGPVVRLVEIGLRGDSWANTSQSWEFTPRPAMRGSSNGPVL